MAYTKTNWVNGTTPINSTNLNKIENGIFTNDTAIGTLSNLNTTEKSNLVGAINGVVESGTNTNGSYVKFSDGTLICRKTVSGSCSAWKAWGDLYESQSSINFGAFPINFIEKPDSISATNVSSSGFFIENLYNTTESNVGVSYLVRPNSISNMSYEISIIAIGKWK